MSSRLVNVRLDEDLMRKVGKLREDGVSLSSLVRTAIEERYAKRAARRKPRDIDAIMKKLYADHPDPPNIPARRYSVHDAKAARRAILRILKRKKR